MPTRRSCCSGTTSARRSRTRWRRDSKRGAAPLAVSALPPPHRQRLSDLHLQSDDALVGDVARLSGEHAALLADPEMRALYLPMIRSDYRAIETYRRDRPPRLTTPLGVMLPLADSGSTTTRRMRGRTSRRARSASRRSAATTSTCATNTRR